MKNLLTLFIIVLSISNGYSQNHPKIYLKNLCNDSINASKSEGVKFINKEYFKFFSILIRDTCNPMNRFTNCYIENNLRCANEFYYNALLIDSKKVKEAEFFLKEWTDSIPEYVWKRFHFFTKDMYRKYIRLYGGCTNENGVEFQIIQFLTKKEFQRNPSYKFMFNLFAIRQTDKLRFLILRKENNKIYLHSYSL